MWTKREKEGEHRVGRHRESFCACYISILKSKRNITIYAVSVAVVVLLFMNRTTMPMLMWVCVCASVCFFLSVSFFFHLVCFCCFSLAVEPQAQMTATARANDGLVGIKFFVIPCVHYHIFRFSSWWIFDACRHCTSVSWHQNVLNVLYDRAQLLANGKLFFLLFFLEKNINFCVCSLTNWINKHLIFWIVALKLGTKYEEKNCANSNTVVINHCDFTWFQEREKTNVSKVFIYRD